MIPTVPYTGRGSCVAANCDTPEFDGNTDQMMRLALAATLWVVLTGMPAVAPTVYSNFDVALRSPFQMV